MAFLLRSYLWGIDVYVLCTLVYLFFCSLYILSFFVYKKKKEKRSPYAFSFLANGIMMPTSRIILNHAKQNLWNFESGKPQDYKLCVHTT